MLDPEKTAEPGHANDPVSRVREPVSRGDTELAATASSDSPAPHYDDEEDYGPPEPSLADDVSALVEDGKTYVEAELAFQKTRARYTAKQGKRIVVYTLGTLAFVHLALMALVVGLVMALAPIVTIWGSIAIVTGLLLLAAGVLVYKLRRRLDKVSQAFAEDGNERD